jgi:radical SAM protein with 4Fe4S-binding SPASM domain
MNNQDNELIESILNRTFFTAWKNQKYLEDPYKYGNYSELELQVTAACNLQCKYCYYSKYSKDLYPPEISHPQTILNNTNLILEWLTNNSFYPKISLFSGELFSQKIGFQVLNKVINWHIENKISNGQIIIPTNFTFLFDKEKTKRIEFFLMKAAIHKINIYLSASIDGKYCDENRPLKNKNMIRTERYYNDVFQFCKKWNFSFHPMIYNEKIEKWIDNFLWFQENFEKHNLDWKSLYLLEVRNKEWTKPQLKEFYKFIRFIIKWSYHKSGLSKEQFSKFVLQHKLFNIFHIFTILGRGISCSIQSAMQLRLGDLTTTLCHRNAYKELNLFKFKTDKHITGIETINTPMLISMFSSKNSNFPFCESCAIKEFCTGQCLGSMYETNKDNFIPIPTVCNLEHIKVAAIIDELKELDLLKFFYNINVSKRNSIKLYEQQWGKHNES